MEAVFSALPVLGLFRTLRDMEEMREIVFGFLLMRFSMSARLPTKGIFSFRELSGLVVVDAAVAAVAAVEALL